MSKSPVLLLGSMMQAPPQGDGRAGPGSPGPSKAGALGWALLCPEPVACWLSSCRGRSRAGPEGVLLPGRGASLTLLWVPHTWPTNGAPLASLRCCVLCRQMQQRQFLSHSTPGPRSRRCSSPPWNPPSQPHRYRWQSSLWPLFSRNGSSQTSS